MQDKTLEYYMSLPYTAEIRQDKDGYFAKVLELPGCTAFAVAFEDLGPMIRDAMAAWIECSLEHGDTIPEPISTEER